MQGRVRLPAEAHILGNVMMVCPVFDLDSAHADAPLLCSFICASIHVFLAFANVKSASIEAPSSLNMKQAVLRRCASQYTSTSLMEHA